MIRESTIKKRCMAMHALYMILKEGEKEMSLIAFCKEHKTDTYLIKALKDLKLIQADPIGKRDILRVRWLLGEPAHATCLQVSDLIEKYRADTISQRAKKVENLLNQLDVQEPKKMTYEELYAWYKRETEKVRDLTAALEVERKKLARRKKRHHLLPFKIVIRNPFIIKKRK